MQKSGLAGAKDYYAALTAGCSISKQIKGDDGAERRLARVTCRSREAAKQCLESESDQQETGFAAVSFWMGRSLMVT